VNIINKPFEELKLKSNESSGVNITLHTNIAGGKGGGIKTISLQTLSLLVDILTMLYPR